MAFADSTSCLMNSEIDLKIEASEVTIKEEDFQYHIEAHDTFNEPLDNDIDRNAKEDEVPTETANQFNEKNAFKCNNCESSFVQDFDLLVHLQTFHGKFNSPIKNEESFVKSEIDEESPNLLKCDLCPKIFTFSLSLKYHIRTSHGESKRFNCDLCKKSYSQKINLKHHIGALHRYSTKCKICQKMFASVVALMAHVRWLHPKHKNSVKVINKCQFCQQTFTRNTSLNRHVRNLHEKLKCDLCEKDFSKNLDLKNHVFAIHKSKCKICQERFASKARLMNHMRWYHSKSNDFVKKTTFKCKICESIFTQSSSLHRHVRTLHQKSKAVQQNQSDEISKRLQNKENEKAQKYYQCNLCSNRFSEDLQLLIHFQSVHGKFNDAVSEVISNCSEEIKNEFRANDFIVEPCHVDVVEHLKVENDTANGDEEVDPLSDPDAVKSQCQMCKLSFPQKYIQEHLQKIHKAVKIVETVQDVKVKEESPELTNNANPEEDEIGLFKCDMCCNIFERLSKLKYHKSNVHQGVKCNFCEKRFPSENSLHNHTIVCDPKLKRGASKIIAKKYKIIQCQICNQYFETAKDPKTPSL